MAAPGHPTVEVLTDQWKHYAAAKDDGKMSLNEFVNYLDSTAAGSLDPRLINQLVDNANDHPDSAREITLEEFIEFVNENWDKLQPKPQG